MNKSNFDITFFVQKVFSVEIRRQIWILCVGTGVGTGVKMKLTQV